MAGALLAAGLLLGCSSDEAPSPEARLAPPTTASAPLDPAGLEPLVLDDAPTGYAIAGDDLGRTGATDLEAAAADAGDPGAAAALADAGFVRGWQRLWVGDDGEDELFLLVYEFDDAEGAEAFFQRTAGEPADDGGEGVFDVPAIPGAVGVSGGGEDLAVNAVIAASGPYLVQVIGNGPAPGPSQGTVVALAAAQVARLA
jgi:hypothetical protein